MPRNSPPPIWEVRVIYPTCPLKSNAGGGYAPRPPAEAEDRGAERREGFQRFADADAQAHGPGGRGRRLVGVAVRVGFGEIRSIRLRRCLRPERESSNGFPPISNLLGHGDVDPKAWDRCGRRRAGGSLTGRTGRPGWVESITRRRGTLTAAPTVRAGVILNSPSREELGAGGGIGHPGSLLNGGKASRVLEESYLKMACKY